MQALGPALAAADQAAGAMNLLILLLPLLLIGWMFLTQRNRTKQMRSFSDSLAVGDQVVTSSGLFGTIAHLDDSSVHLRVADGVIVRFARQAVTMKQSDVLGQVGTAQAPPTSRDADTATDAPDPRDQ